MKTPGGQIICADARCAGQPSGRGQIDVLPTVSHIHDLEVAFRKGLRTGCQTAIAESTSALARAHQRREEQASAQQYLLMAVGAYETLGDGHGLRVVLGELGTCCAEQQLHEQAIHAFRRLLAESDCACEETLRKTALANIAESLLRLERHEEAIQATELLAVQGHDDDDQLVMAGLRVLARSYLALGQALPAAQAAERLLKRAKTVGAAALQAEANVIAGCAAAYLGEHDRAEKLLARGADEAENLRLDRLMLEALWGHTQNMSHKGDLPAALAWYLQYAALNARLDRDHVQSQVARIQSRQRTVRQARTQVRRLSGRRRDVRDWTTGA